MARMKQPGRPKKFPGVVAHAPPSQVEEPRSPESWLQEGIDNGWCSRWYCEHHEGIAHEDMEEFDKLFDEYEGPDFCWPIVHLTCDYMSQELRASPQP